MKKQVLSLALSATMLASMLPKPAFAADNTTFPDMPNDWSTQALQNAISNGLLNGIDGKIAAGENLTRAQMAAIVTRAFGTNGKADISSFGDVNTGDWFYDAMASSVLMGAFQGDGVNLNPNANITRQEAFTVLARLFTLSGGDQSVLNSYTDGAQVADWAKDSMASMVAAGYVKGSDNKLNPTSSITRAEFAQVMDNLVKTYFADSQLNVNANGNAVLNKAGTLEGATISGDLIIGDGAAEGDVVLKDVTVSGRLLVRGGGTSTVTLEGNTTVGSVVVNKPTGAVRVENNTEKTVNVNAVSDNVVLTGDFNEVNANAAQGTVTLTGATVATMNVAGTSAKVVVSEKSTVETMNVAQSASGTAVSVQSGTTVKTMNTAASKAVVTVNGTVGTMSVTGSDTTVKAEEGAKIEKITTSAANTTVSGKGSVTNFEAAQGASGADITTSGTKVVNNGTGDVTTGNDKVIASGSTGTSQSDSTTPGGGTSTGDGDEGYVDTVAPTVQSMAIDGVEVADKSTYYFGGEKTAFESLTATMSENVSLVKDAKAEVKVYFWTGDAWQDQGKYAEFDVSGNKLTLKNIGVSGNGQNFVAGQFKFEVAAGTLQDAAGNKNEALTWEITFEKDQTAPTATNLVINGQDVANGGTYYFKEGAVVETLTATMSETVKLTNGDSGVVKVNDDTMGGTWADYATFTVAEDGKTLNLTIKDDVLNGNSIVAGTFRFKIEADALQDVFGNKNTDITWEVTFEKLNESGAVTVTDLAGLKSALSFADVKTVTVNGDIQMTEDLTINEGVAVTVNSGKTLTVNAGKTLTVNGTIGGEGTVKGTAPSNIGAEDDAILAALSTLKVEGNGSVAGKATGIYKWIEETGSEQVGAPGLKNNADWFVCNQQSVTIRPEGPGKDDTVGNPFDYAAAYTAAGVDHSKLSSNYSLTVDLDKLYAMEYDTEKKNQLDQLVQQAGEEETDKAFFVGLQMKAPADADAVSVYQVSGGSLSRKFDHQLNSDYAPGNYNIYKGSYIYYMGAAYLESAVDAGNAQLAGNRVRQLVLWKDESGNIVDVNYITVNSTNTPAKTAWVSDADQLTAAISDSNITGIQVVENIGSVATAEITKPVTIAESKKMTVNDDATLTLNAAVTGTIEGTSHTSKLVIGEGGSYGELSAGEYVWDVDTPAWVKAPATEGSTLPTADDWKFISSFTLTADCTLKTVYDVPENKTLVIAEDGFLDAYDAGLSGDGSVVVKGGTLKINANYNNGGDNKVPTVATIQVNHGGTLASMTTNEKEEQSNTPTNFVGPDETARIQTTEGASVTFELGEFGEENKPKMIISGNVTIPEKQTWYSMFDTGVDPNGPTEDAGDAIGIDMTLEKGKMTVNGNLVLSSASRTGSSLTVGSNASVEVNGTVKVNAYASVTANGRITGGGSAKLIVSKAAGTAKITGTGISGVTDHSEGTYTWSGDAWTTGK